MTPHKLIIGLEIHVELATKQKMFCQCSANWFGMQPNTNTCPVCLGLPGGLPVPNKQAIEWCLLLGKALNCKVSTVSKFDRKHYMYPDLAKGYQISQYDEPFNYDGYYMLKTATGEKRIGITRIHMEEDTGKLSHEQEGSLIDFNRAGCPLVEIVTEADFDNGEDAKKFLEELQVIIRYLGISDADMDKGSMRMEPNISVKLLEKTKDDWEQPLTESGYPTYKVEAKNINSFNFVKKTIDIEEQRQLELLEKGIVPDQETRGYDDVKGITFSQRKKENAADYRYFPEPDIPPFSFTKKYLDEIFTQMKELPHEKIARYVREWGIKEQDAYVVTRDKKLAEYFEAVVTEYEKNKADGASEQKILNLITNKKLDITLTPRAFYEKAREILKPRTFDPGALTVAITTVIATNPQVAADYKAGKVNVIMFLVGQVMKETKGQADAQLVKKTLEEALT